MGAERLFLVGFCRACGAGKYRRTWGGPVECDHKPGCLEKQRDKAKQRRLK